MVPPPLGRHLQVHDQRAHALAAALEHRAPCRAAPGRSSRSAAGTARRGGSAGSAGLRRWSTGQCSSAAMRCSMRWISGASPRSKNMPSLVRAALTSLPPLRWSTVSERASRGARQLHQRVAFGIGQETAEQHHARALHRQQHLHLAVGQAQHRWAPRSGRGSGTGEPAAGRRSSAARLRGLQRLRQRRARHAIVPAAGVHGLQDVVLRAARIAPARRSIRATPA